jgi:hypothetical protein
MNSIDAEKYNSVRFYNAINMSCQIKYIHMCICIYMQFFIGLFTNFNNIFIVIKLFNIIYFDCICIYAIKKFIC